MPEHQIRNGKTRNGKNPGTKPETVKSGTPIYGTVLLDGIVKYGTSNLENISGQKGQNSPETPWWLFGLECRCHRFSVLESRCRGF